MNKDFKMVAFELFYVAAAPFCGPIATLRDRNVHTEQTIPDELQNNIVFFSHKGKLLRKVPFVSDHRVLTFSFTSEEVLLIVLNTGQYFLVDPFRGGVKQFKLAASFTAETLLSCKTIDSKLYFLSTNKRIYEVKNIFQPVAKEIILLAVKLDNPVMHINNNTEGGVVDVVYLHETNEIYSWQTNEKVLTCDYLTDKKSKLVYVNRKVYREESYMLVVFHNPLRVGFIKGNRSNFYELAGLKIFEEPTISNRRGKSSWRESSYHSGWMGDMAILSNNLWSLMVSLTKCQRLEAVPSGRICGQLDAVRIYSESNYILRLVPSSYYSLFQPDINPSIDVLYRAFQSYQKGQLISKDQLEGQREHIQDHLDSIIEAASFSLEPLEQMRILKFGIFVKTYFCLTVNLKELCDELRIINNLRCEYLNRCLTLRQFQHLQESQKERLLNILLRYNLHYLGEIVGGGEKVYVHWAKCKIEKESEQLALKEILEKFQSYELKEGRKISYIDIARYAMETGRFTMAQNLIGYEPNIEKRVTILLWMAVVKKDGGFLERAIENAEISRSSDVIFKVAREINKLENMSEAVMKSIEKYPLVKKHYLEYLRQKNLPKLKEYYIRSKATYELGFLAIRENLSHKDGIPEESMQLISKLLPTVSQGLNARKANEYAAYLRKLMTTTAPVNDAQLDKFKDVEHPEYLARALVERGLTEQAVKVLYWIRSDNAYRYLQQLGRWKESATLAKQRKNISKLKQLLQQAPQQFVPFINQLIAPQAPPQV